MSNDKKRTFNDYNTFYSRDLRAKPLTKPEQDWLRGEANQIVERMLHGKEANLIPFVLEEASRRFLAVRAAQEPKQSEQDERHPEDRMIESAFRSQTASPFGDDNE